MFLIAVHILLALQKFQSFRKWHKVMDANFEDEGSITNQYKDTFLKYVKHNYCLNNHKMPNIKIEMPNHKDLFSTSPVPGPGHSFNHPYDMPSDDAEYITPASVVESTSR
jgi:hypothetical protein